MAVFPNCTCSTTPERVDEDINKYLLLVSDLRSQKNSFLPIFRLPPETLVNVFTHAARDYYEGDVPPVFCAPHWVNISYVCRHWRNVALNCPTLWTYHFNVSPRWTKELLARSKQASLKIRIDYEYGKAKFCWARLIEESLNRAEQIQILRLNIPNSILPTEFSLNASRLEILEIHLRDYPSQSRTFKINNEDSFALRILKLTACPLPWHSSLNLSGMSILSLSYIPSPSQQDVVEFLTTLSHMPALAVLHLEHALPSSRGLLSSQALDIFPAVTLSCLARLFVCAPLSTAVALLSRMVIPLKTQVRLEIESEDYSSIDDYAQLPSVLAQRFCQSEDSSLSSPTIRSLAIRLSRQSGFVFCASEGGDRDPTLFVMDPSQDYGIPLMVRVDINPPVARSNWACIVGDICCSIPSAFIRTLHVINQPFSPDFWRKTLGHLTELRYMKLSYRYMPDLASLLNLPADEPLETSSGDATGDDDPTPGHAFAPRLEELELYRIIFSSEDDLSYDMVSEQSLRGLLSTRKALRLTMTECDVRVEKDKDGAEDEDEEDEEDGTGICDCDLCTG